MRKRWCRACVVVGVVLVVLVGWQAVVDTTRPAVMKEALHPALWEDTAFADGAWAAGVCDQIPEGFESEVFALHNRDDLHVDAQTGIMGFSLAKSPGDAFQDLACTLTEAGWEHIEAASTTQDEARAPTFATFVKASGKYRWVFVSCVSVGSATSVVVQIDPACFNQT